MDTRNTSSLARKPLQVALACLLTVGALPASAFAEEDPASAGAASTTIEQGEAVEPGEATDGETRTEPDSAEEPSGRSDGSSTLSPDAGSYDQTESYPYVSEISDEEIAALLTGSDESQGDSISAFSLDALAVGEVTTAGAVRPFSGDDRYETAAMQAAYGWQSSRFAVVAGGEGWPDALSASSLAGALDCPVLLTSKASLAQSAAETLTSLGVCLLYTSLQLDQNGKHDGNHFLFSYEQNDWFGIDRIDDDTPGFEIVLSEGDMRLYRILPADG